MTQLLSKIFLHLLILSFAISASAREYSDAVIKQLEIARKQAGSVAQTLDRFKGFLESEVLPVVPKEGEAGRWITDFDISASIKQKTAGELDLFFSGMKSSIEQARHYPNSMRDEKECRAWMDVFDSVFSRIEKELSDIKGSNPTDSDLGEVIVSSASLGIYSGQLSSVINLCILNKGYGISMITPSMERMRKELESGTSE